MRLQPEETAPPEVALSLFHGLAIKVNMISDFGMSNFDPVIAYTYLPGRRKKRI